MHYGVFQPFLFCELPEWTGLPRLTLDEMARILGAPRSQAVQDLGYYPADRYVFPLATPTGGLIAYLREGHVVMVETVAPPRSSVPVGLPEPCGRLPHEFLVAGAYAHEFVYCEKGLVLTVACALDHSKPEWLIRYRGVRPLAHVREFGPEYYKAFEDRNLF